MKQTRKRKPLSERLWALIQKGSANDCWLWQGTSVPKGYGTLRKCVDGNWQNTYDHREVLIEAQGEPPFPEAQALHSCDTPGCCNPTHLSWGTNSRNRREARDRLHNQGNQKLQPEQVENIRKDPRTHVEIADDYGVHFDTVARIKQSRAWRAA